MARLPRISPVGLPVHLIQRGNNRQSCFGALEDYSAYMGWLKEYSKQYAVDIHAWVLRQIMFTYFVRRSRRER